MRYSYNLINQHIEAHRRPASRSHVLWICRTCKNLLIMFTAENVHRYSNPLLGMKSSNAIADMTSYGVLFSNLEALDKYFTKLIRLAYQSAYSNGRSSFFITKHGKNWRYMRKKEEAKLKKSGGGQKRFCVRCESRINSSITWKG